MRQAKYKEEWGMTDRKGESFFYGIDPLKNIHGAFSDGLINLALCIKKP